MRSLSARSSPPIRSVPRVPQSCYLGVGMGTIRHEVVYRVGLTCDDELIDVFDLRQCLFQRLSVSCRVGQPILPARPPTPSVLPGISPESAGLRGSSDGVTTSSRAAGGTASDRKRRADSAELRRCGTTPRAREHRALRSAISLAGNYPRGCGSTRRDAVRAGSTSVLPARSAVPRRLPPAGRPDVLPVPEGLFRNPDFAPSDSTVPPPRAPRSSSRYPPSTDAPDEALPRVSAAASP